MGAARKLAMVRIANGSRRKGVAGRARLLATAAEKLP